MIVMDFVRIFRDEIHHDLETCGMAAAPYRGLAIVAGAAPTRTRSSVVREIAVPCGITQGRSAGAGPADYRLVAGQRHIRAQPRTDQERPALGVLRGAAHRERHPGRAPRR